MLAGKGIHLKIDSTVAEYIFDNSNSDMFGAREINSVISRVIETKISDMLLSSGLKSGVSAILIAQNGEIKVKLYQPVIS